MGFKGLISIIYDGGGVTDVPRTSSSDVLIRAATSDPDTQDVDSVYRQATDFITFSDRLRRELWEEQVQQRRLDEACVQVRESLEHMRRTVSELRARADTTD